ncbi:MAG: serine/threonine-protein kinase [Planctomycetota bacterium]
MKICLSCEGVAATDATACAACGGRLLGTDEIHFPVRRGEEDATHPLLGTLVDGKYRVAGVLGRGGMGAVFRATHEVSLMPVALKLLHPRLAGRAEYRAQFLAEARKAGRVVHEHTARILDVGETQDGSIFIAQELVPGNTLHEWLQASTPMRPEAVVEILRQVCAALAAAHGVGLVHRDLTPRNIMVDVRHGRPHAKVLDFGIARGGRERPPGAGDDALSAFASPPYAAPEHLAGLDVDARADLYGLGVIAYELLCGRVPTDGRTPREHAAATLRGELAPFVPRWRVPRRLQRLVESLLAREPGDRPASATVVLAELAAIAAPGSGRPRVLALGALLVATAGLALTFAGTRPAPFLSLTPSHDLELLPSMPVGVKVTPLPSRKLTPLHFDFGDFDVGRLTVEVWQSAEQVARQQVHPEVRGSTFSLDVRQPDYAKLIDVVKTFSRQGPVFLKFVVPGKPPLAYAALRIDDDPPVLTWSAQGLGDAGSVREESTFRWEMSDQQPSELTLEVEHAGSCTRASLPLEGKAVAARELLGAAFPPPSPVREVTLRLVGKDAAGNVVRTDDMLCPVVDLGAPRIVRVVGARAEARRLLVGSNGVRLRVELSGSEPALRVAFGPLGAPTPCDDLDEAGSGVDVTWKPTAPGLPPDGRYELLLADAAGNEARYTDAYTFATERLDAVLTPAGADAVAASAGRVGRAVVAKGGVLWDGRPAALVFRCNPFYRPQSVDVVTADGGEPNAEMVRVVDVVDGGGTIVMAAARDGRYHLTVHARATIGGDEQEAAYQVLVRREPITLRIPDTSDCRFLPQLAETGALSWQNDTLGDGRAWSLDPPDSRWLRGSVWFGSARPAAHALPERESETDPLLPRLQPWRGENVLGVELRDALDRPVTVLRGDRTAPPLTDAVEVDGQRPVELMRFFWHDEGPRARTSEVHVEYGQAARFVVDAPLPYAPGDSLELYLDTVPCRPRSVAAGRGGGCELEFELPFERLQALARLGGLGPDEFAENRLSAPFALRLVAPDGRHDFEVRARTSRTTLEPQRLGDLAGSDPVPPPLADVLMVPILGPGIGRSWPDPVPAGTEARATFRPSPAVEVRNVEDCYLQQHEVTRAEYAAVIRALAAARERGDPLPVSELVHHGDVRGPDRLRLENLVPHIHRGQVEGFAQAVSAGGDRPVTGLDFYQAYTFSRAVGWLLVREPDLLRLPMGVELELAALGSEPAAIASELRLNGAERAGGVRVVSSSAAAAARPDPARWPPTARELAAAGDRVVTDFGVEMTGLDFGVREWVGDVPAAPGDSTMFEASADHVRHLEAVSALASGRLRPEVARSLLRFGSVRGLALDELATAAPGNAVHAKGRWPARVPGVVRVLQMARDGSGVLPDEVDPHLAVLGVRLCGGRRFLARVRSR